MALTAAQQERMASLPVLRDNVSVSRLTVLNAMLQVTAQGCHG